LLLLAIQLFAVSFLLLFAEVMCIRWFAIELPLLRVFPNLVLTTIFIGTSAGLATHGQPKASPLVLSLCVVLSLAFLIAGQALGVQVLSIRDERGVLLSLAFIGAVVVNLTILFVTVGRCLGEEFEKLPPLKAYSVNLLGSIAGVIAFGIISWLWLPPAAWLAVAATLVFILARKRYVIAVGLAAVIAAFAAGKDSTWSPYGRVQLIPTPQADKTALGTGNYKLMSNGDFLHGGTHVVQLQSWTEIAAKYANCTKWDRAYRYWLEVPYLVSQSADKLLVLGAGSGCDVECALQHGAKQIDAVERDPFIASCGFDRHPDRPYKNNRVNVIVDDARTFLRYSPEKYDMIQFAYLDPGATLKLSSFLRSDNFVYTRESLKSAISHLNDHGVLCISFATGADSPVTRRLYRTLTDAYGKPPMALVQDYTGSSFFFLGPGLKALPEEIVKPAGFRMWPGRGEYTDTRPSTDDWPFLYLDFTNSAVLVYAFVLIAAAIIPLSVMRKSISGKAPLVELAPMLFLGMAFMLVETKSITQLSLLFGATWIVSSIVILIILTMAYFSNLIIDRIKSPRIEYCYAGLVGTLILDYALRIPTSTNLPPIALSVGAATVACLPVFFGGMIFSILLKRSQNAVLLLASNVLGVAFGGLLENLCIVVGIKALSLVALGLYLASALPLIATRFHTKKPSLPEVLTGPS
jgi:hypothetical protein